MDGQSVAAQVAELTAVGAMLVFCETASGARTDRARLRGAPDTLNESDVWVVTRLDPPAISTRDLLNTFAIVAARKSAGEPVGEIARSYNVHNSTISRQADGGIKRRLCGMVG